MGPWLSNLMNGMTLYQWTLGPGHAEPRVNRHLLQEGAKRRRGNPFLPASKVEAAERPPLITELLPFACPISTAVRDSSQRAGDRP